MEYEQMEYEKTQTIKKEPKWWEDDGNIVDEYIGGIRVMKNPKDHCAYKDVGFAVTRLNEKNSTDVLFFIKSDEPIIPYINQYTCESFFDIKECSSYQQADISIMNVLKHHRITYFDAIGLMECIKSRILKKFLEGNKDL